MVYLPSINTYLHQSSLLLSAYPTTTRITTKYTVPPRHPPSPRPIPSDRQKPQSTTPSSQSKPPPSRPETKKGGEGEKEKRQKPATLTFKTYEPTSGICLKYVTDKQAEVGRLMVGLGRLARGEEIPESGVVTGTGTGGGGVEDKMDVDGGGVAAGEGQAAAVPVVTGGTTAGGSGGGGGKKKKKGKK